MEHVLGAALSAGLTQAEFWSSTPYLTRIATSARTKRQMQMAAMSGWYAEVFARTERLPEAAELLGAKEAEVNEAETVRERAIALGWEFKPVAASPDAA